jgi:uncharacterized repeat protein (TIGR03803 family)
MQRTTLTLRIARFAAVLGFLTAAVPAFAASPETVLYNFCSANGCADGAGPRGPLALDASGNLYGTTLLGGAHSHGTVFQLTPGGNGTWTETVLYSFCSTFDCRDGQLPSAGLTLDAAGNLYGTALGGAHLGGEVFKLTPGKSGKWSEKRVHSFCLAHGCPDGKDPYGGLIFDAAGNLYGTTTVGGAYKKGTVFELIPGAHGGWSEKVLHSFSGKDGRGPMASLTFDATGNLYGTTNGGGANGVGTVFELSPGKNGKWSEKVLHSFNNNGKDGYNPYAASVIFDATGSLYTATAYGGGHGHGAVFQFTPGNNGQWTQTALYSFCIASGCADGSGPVGTLIFDAAGNLYGSTGAGGTGNSCGEGCGTVFQLTPGTNGWTETVLYSFAGGADGQQPNAPLIFDAAGNLYGTGGGGANGDGTVFELSPDGGGKWTETVLHSFGNGTDGREPLANLIFDAAGNLYGTTAFGGADAGGTVFELSPGSNGTWTETVLHNFCFSGNGCKDGRNPEAGLVFDPAGNLYGTTYTGGTYRRSCGSQCGVVFRLKPGASGKWTEKVLWTFNNTWGSQSPLIRDVAGNLYGMFGKTAFELTPSKGGNWTEKVLHEFDKGTGGTGPIGSLIFDGAGNLYSTTAGGGAYGYGTVYELMPAQNGKWTETILHSFANDGDGTSPRAGLIFDSAGNLYSTTTFGGIDGGGTIFEITP